ncbi:MAG: hypothetical protein MUE54_08040 [Anaerolineae bacterium]|jgi:hypothetical protein|nr:hypothetical protein [Anaerolineae bacterium]
MPKPANTSPRPTFWEQVASMNRLLRLLLVAIFAISTTLAFSPLIDSIYLQYFFTPETRILPSLIAMGLGLVMYAFGWFYLVGSFGQPILITRGLKWVVYIGILTIVIILLWMTSLLMTSL